LISFFFQIINLLCLNALNPGMSTSKRGDRVFGWYCLTKTALGAPLASVCSIDCDGVRLASIPRTREALLSGGASFFLGDHAISFSFSPKLSILALHAIGI